MSPFEWTSLGLTAAALAAGTINVFVTLKVDAKFAKFEKWALKTFVLRREAALSNPKPKRREHAS